MNRLVLVRFCKSILSSKSGTYTILEKSNSIYLSSKVGAIDITEVVQKYSHLNTEFKYLSPRGLNELKFNCANLLESIELMDDKVFHELVRVCPTNTGFDIFYYNENLKRLVLMSKIDLLESSNSLSRLIVSIILKF